MRSAARNCGRKALGGGSGTQSKTKPTARRVKGKRVARAEFGLQASAAAPPHVNGVH
jgi:hypothetical protein